MANEGLTALASSLADDACVDADLVCAIASVESNWNSWAVRYEPDYHYLETPTDWALRVGFSVETEVQLQKMSWGLMQVMGGVARQYGFDKPLTQLLVPSEGLKIAIRHLKSKIERYAGVEKNIIAAYNGGVPVVTNGVYKNQKYIDLVSQRLREIRLTKRGI